MLLRLFFSVVRAAVSTAQRYSRGKRCERKRPHSISLHGVLVWLEFPLPCLAAVRSFVVFGYSSR